MAAWHPGLCLDPSRSLTVCFFMESVISPHESLKSIISGVSVVMFLSLQRSPFHVIVFHTITQPQLCAAVVFDISRGPFFSDLFVSGITACRMESSGNFMGARLKISRLAADLHRASLVCNQTYLLSAAVVDFDVGLGLPLIPHYLEK